MFRYSLFVLCLCIVGVSSCKVVKYTPEKFPGNQIRWGSGGGFAGIETTYVLLPNGQLFKRAGVGASYIELKPLKKKEARDYFEKVASLQLFKQDIDKPGNMYYFLREITEATDSQATWGAGDYIPPKGLVTLYKALNALADRPPLKKQKASVQGENNDKEPKPQDPTKW